MTHRIPKVVFVEDEALLRGLLSDFFQHSGDFRVVGACGRGGEAIELITLHTPDLVVLDLQLPDMHGRSVVDAIKRLAVVPKFVVLSGNTNPLFVRELLAMGVGGILQKGISAAEVMAACKRVLQGGVCLDLPANDLRNLATAAFAADAPRLTPREMEILDMVARGLKSKEIAVAFDVSVRTIDKHRENLMRKLGIHDVGGLVRYAAQHGLVQTSNDGAREALSLGK